MNERSSIPNSELLFSSQASSSAWSPYTSTCTLKVISVKNPVKKSDETRQLLLLCSGRHLGGRGGRHLAANDDSTRYQPYPGDGCASSNYDFA